jgi:hypothetical protein
MKRRRTESSAPKEEWFQVTYRISAFPLSACSTGTWHIRIIDSSWLCSPRTPFGRTRIDAPPFRARRIRSEASSFSRPFARPQRLPVAGSPRWGHHARPTKSELHQTVLRPFGSSACRTMPLPAKCCAAESPLRKTAFDSLTLPRSVAPLRAFNPRDHSTRNGWASEACRGWNVRSPFAPQQLV